MKVNTYQSSLKNKQTNKSMFKVQIRTRIIWVVSCGLNKQKGKIENRLMIRLLLDGFGSKSKGLR